MTLAPRFTRGMLTAAALLFLLAGYFVLRFLPNLASERPNVQRGAATTAYLFTSALIFAVVDRQSRPHLPLTLIGLGVMFGALALGSSLLGQD